MIYEELHYYTFFLTEDRKQFMSPRRQLTVLGLTTQQYREKWNLQSDHLIVLRNYVARRSALAKENGLGQNR
jgi:predicted transcriptional regulator